LDLSLDQPNIFQLYEQHIGPLTPMIADTLREAERIYPADWIEEAIRLAVENNVRRWRYVDAILRRGQEEGRDDRKDGRDTEKDRRRYAEWENS
jgi:DnaD/phage-associated family protein